MSRKEIGRTAYSFHHHRNQYCKGVFYKFHQRNRDPESLSPTPKDLSEKLKKNHIRTHKYIISGCTHTSFWVCEIHRDTLGDTDFVQLQIWVTGDDSSRQEVDTFAYQVPAKTSFLSLETSPDGFYRSARFSQSLRGSSDSIVHVDSNVELERGWLPLIKE